MVSGILTAGIFILVYIVLMLLLLRGWEKHNYWEPGKHEYCSYFSVLIPVRNEQNNILKLLYDLKIQDYDNHFYEIIIVDDHSTDSTFQICRKFKNRNPSLNIKVSSLDDGEYSKKSALEQGYSIAGGDAVITMDADCSTGDAFLKTLNAYYRRERPRLLLGPVFMRSSGNLFSRFQSLEFSSLIFSAAGSVGMNIPFIANGANMLVDRSVIESDEPGKMMNAEFSSGDDMFLLDYVKNKWGASAVKFMNNKNATIYIGTCDNLKDLISQRKRWISKSKGYKDPVQILVALLILLMALVQVIGLILIFIYPEISGIVIAFWGLKMLIDSVVLQKITRFFNERSLQKWILPLSLIYPFYVIFTAFSGLFTSYHWKGRKGK